VYASSGQESMMPDISYPYLEKLVAVAKVNYPHIKMLQDKALQAKTGISKAQMGWFNGLSFTYLYSPNNSSTLVNPSLFNGYQLGVYLNLGNLLVTGPTIKIARQELDIALDNQAEYYLNIEALVKERYFNYIRQLAILGVRSKNAEDIQSSVQQVKYKFEKGEETLDNYNKGLTFYANAIQVKIESEGQVLIAKSALEELLGEKLEEVK
jgi:outer membrane protein TolC